jgi:uncharacterized membrane protein YdjX (TVP38/TMEM64 family)
MKVNKKLLTIILLTLFISWIMFSLYLYSIWFKVEDLVKYTESNMIIIILWELFIFSIRIFLFLPISILIITLWTIIDNILLTFLISIIWVFIWIIQTYYIWYLINKDLEWNKLIGKIEKHIKKLKKNWFYYIFFWSLFPMVPVDLIYYAAWFEKYNIYKFIFASFLWSIPIVFIYSYLWDNASLLIQKITYIIVILLIIILIYLIFKKIFKKK